MGIVGKNFLSVIFSIFLSLVLHFLYLPNFCFSDLSRHWSTTVHPATSIPVIGAKWVSAYSKVPKEPLENAHSQLASATGKNKMSWSFESNGEKDKTQVKPEN